MPLLTRTAIQEVVALFKKRGMYFYHACQLQDFDTYVTLGGIPSRHLMETSGHPYTPFDTDKIDHTNGVWPKVFGNLSDFGRGFAVGQWSEGKAPTPNPFGPILLVANPEILLEAQDVAISLRSAGGKNFNREVESLSSALEVDRLFVYPADAPDRIKRTYIKYSDQLRKDFSEHCAVGNVPSTYNPEISCTAPNERLSLAHLSYIVVDRYYKNNQSLLSRVEKIALPARLLVEVRERQYRDGRREILSDISFVLQDRIVPAALLQDQADLAPTTRNWAARIVMEGLEWQYLRFAKYLRVGTLSQS